MDFLKKHFTPEEIEALRGYVHNIKAWNAEKPEQITEAEEKYIIEYAKQHNGEIPAEYKNRVELQYKIEDQDGGADLGGNTTKPIINDIYFNSWINKLHTITDIQTMYKCVDLINSERIKEGRIKLLLAPGYEDDYIEITEAIINLLGEDKTEENTKVLTEAITAAFVTFPERSSQLLITHKDYQYALLPYKNDKAYIVDFDKQLKFTFDAAGDAVIDLRTEADKQAYTNTLNKDNIPANIADTDLLSTLATAVLSSYCSNYGDRITVYYPNFARALGVQIDDTTAQNKHFDIWDKIKQLENIGGVLVEDKSILRAFVLLGYNRAENTLTFASPYLYRLMDILKKHPASVSKNKKDNKPLWEIIGTSFLIDNRIIKARNKITSQLIKNIIAGLYQYGVKPESARNPGKHYTDKTIVSYRISFRSLIERTPLLNETLQTSQTSNKARILTRSFLGSNYSKSGITIIEEYMKEYTHAFEYWKDLKIDIPTPSLKSLSEQITISHHGINGDFKNNLYIPAAHKPGEKKDLN